MLDGTEMFRIITASCFVGTMAISTFYRRRARAEGETIPRRRESTLLIAGRAVVALPLFGSVILYIAAPQVMAWAAFSIPNWVRGVGAVLGLASVPMAYWVFSSLGPNVSETVLTKEEHVLVTGGPYRWVRHPLYLTGLMLFAGIGLMNSSWFVVGLSVVTLVGILTLVIPREEAHLVARFGDRYRDLVRRTGRLLPRIERRGGRAV